MCEMFSLKLSGIQIYLYCLLLKDYQIPNKIFRFFSLYVNKNIFKMQNKTFHYKYDKTKHNSLINLNYVELRLDLEAHMLF